MSDPLPAGQRRKVSILYFEGCPNHRPTVDLVGALIRDLGLDAVVEEVELTSPDEVERLRFLGSPTVQVDGLDIEPAARSRKDYAMSCRLYQTSDGLPSRDMLLAALGAQGDESRDEPAGRSRSSGGACCSETVEGSLPRAGLRESSGVPDVLIATGGSLVAAMLSSACCWLPLLVVAFGASAAGVSNFFGPWRPFFIVAAVAMLALSFYLTFVRKPVAHCCSGVGPSQRRLGRATWCVSAAVVAAFIFFPQYIGLAFVGSTPLASARTSASHAPSLEFAFHVEGMHCQACASTLTATLSKIDGVTRASVHYASKTAQVLATDERVIQRVLDATRRAGFSASLDPGSKPASLRDGFRGAGDDRGKDP
jgi:copper chaperone CopZ